MQRLRFSPGFQLTADGGTPTPRLYRLEGSTKVGVPFHSMRIDDFSAWLEPTVAQPVGTALVLELDRPQGCDAQSATYTVTEAKPLPTSVGTLSSTLARKKIEVASGASCSETVDASYADFRIALATEALPYASLFTYQTYLDGELAYRFSKNTSTGEGLPQGEDRVFTLCGSYAGKPQSNNEQSPGTHRVRFEATLPDGTKLSTPEVSFELRCDGTADAGVKNDAGVKADSGITGGVDSGLPSNASNDDDSCSLASKRSGFSLGLLALALLLRQRRAKVA
ncbi:MAG TPA: hypothetical protein VFX59_07280 [Polyangiales bacterium]|nr:hypothetical protein [Polyangiales bacterium]